MLNERGLDRAIAAGAGRGQRGRRRHRHLQPAQPGRREARRIAAWRRIASRARAAGLRTTVTVAAAFGCPFEGEVAPDRVARGAAPCVQAQPDEVALADTIGVGVPAAVRALADVAADEAPGVPLRWHFHNTRNTGYANAITAVERGARRRSTPAPAGSAAARSLRPPPATSPPRTCFTSWTGPEWTPEYPPPG